MISPIAMLYVAMLVAFAFTCLTIAQTAYYFTFATRKDRLWTKTFVALLAVGDIVHQVCLIQAVYFWSVKNGNDPVALNEIPGGLFGQAIMEGIIALLVQGFYMYRISKLAKSKWTALPVAIMSAGQAALLGVYMAFVTHKDTMVGLGNLTDLAHALNSTTAATDIVIASTMTWLLMKSKTGFRRSDTIVDRLLIYCIMSGAATSITAILVIITLATIPATNVYLLFFFFIPKAYCNSCLLVLNRRRSIQESSSVEWNEYTSSMDRAASTRSQIVGRDRPAQVTITMDTFTDDQEQAIIDAKRPQSQRDDVHGDTKLVNM